MFKLNFKKGWHETLSTIKRFPLAYLAAIVVTASLMAYSQLSFNSYILANENAWLIRLALTGVFGFFMFYALQLVTETKKFKHKQFWMGAGLVVILLALIYTFQYQYFEWPVGEMKTVGRTVGGFVALYLAACSLAFWGFKTKQNAFWQYVLRLGIRIAQAFVVFGILFGGIAALLGTVSFLFEANISSVVYTHVFIVLAGLGATSFVMRGVEENVNSLDKVKEYPKFVEVVAHYVLIPLVYVYAAVVLVYLVQALVMFEWPKYGTSELLGVFLLVGLSAFMMTFPHAGKKDWAGFYHKYFFVFALIIAAAMLLGIAVRISEFGFTVNRYLIGMLGVFIVFLSIWKLFAKNFDIRNVHYTAIVFILVTLYGPVSAFSATWFSQTARLEAAIVDENVSQFEVNSLIRELTEVAYAPRVQTYLNDITQNNEFQINHKTTTYDIADQFVKTIGIEYKLGDPTSSYMPENGLGNENYFTVDINTPIQQVDLEGFNYYLTFNFYPGSNNMKYTINGEEVELSIIESVFKLGDLIEEDLSEFFEKFGNKPYYYSSAEEIEVRGEDFVIQFEYIDGLLQDDKVEVQGASGYILIK